MRDVAKQSARAEVMHAEGRPLPAVFSAGLPYRAELERAAQRVVHDRGHAEDVVQQVHMDALRTTSAGWTPTDLRLFLLYLTHLRAVDVARRQRRDRSLLEALEAAGLGGAQPSDIGPLTRDALVDVAKLLTPEVWNLWVAVRVCGATYAEAAERFALSPKSVERRLARAQRKINQHFLGES